MIAFGCYAYTVLYKNFELVLLPPLFSLNVFYTFPCLLICSTLNVLFFLSSLKLNTITSN